MVRITKYLILIDLKNNGRALMVHGLMGYVDILDRENALLLNHWLEGGVKVSTEPEKQLYECLSSKKYLLSEEEERELKNKLENKLLSRHKEIISNPHIATFIPSYRCNFNCPYCFEKDVNRKSPVMTEEQVNQVFSLYPPGQLQHINFYGGEPFLPEHKKIIEYIISKAPSVEYSAISNGYYLEEFIPTIEHLKIKHIQITFDGHMNEHNRTRQLLDGSGTFEKIIAGVESALQHNIPIQIRMNISKQNVNDCYSFKDWLTEKFNGNNLLTFDMQELFQYQTEDKAVLSEQIIEMSSIGKKNVILDSMPGLARFLYNGKPFAPVINGCTSGIANRLYDPYGDIYSCYLGVGCKSKRVGTYYPTVSMNPASILYRTANNIDECKECKYLFLCGGGCPNPIISDNGDSLKPNCSKIYHMISYLIPQLYSKKVQRQVRHKQEEE